jgi:cytidyltransferase-like protein
MKKQISVSGAFDDIGSRDLRFLEEAAKLGELSVLLWPDELIQKKSGLAPKFPLAERDYFLSAVRFVSRVLVAENSLEPNALPKNLPVDIWTDVENPENFAREKFCREKIISYRIFKADELKGFPELPPLPSAPGKKKIVVTGCYDWFHSGHVRFCEEVSAHGDLFVIVGHDENIRLLKGEGHPLLPEDERRYVVSSIKFVKQALISSGEGLARRRPRNQKIAARHLRRERGRRQGRKARVLRKTWPAISRAQTHARARIAETEQHGFARLLGSSKR